MRKNILQSTGIALILSAMLPLTTFAQEKEAYLRPSNWNPYDQRGINRFETSKQADTIPYEGMRIRFGAGFTMQFQDLKHSNAALNNTGAGANRLYPLAPGFMTAQANLFTDVQLADGVRMNVTTYLSSRHHNEAWVKGGYIQIDKTPFIKSAWLDKIMEIATIKVGHMEINYGDAHFRRPDGGHTLQSPFAEGNIADAFATEMAGEVYLQKNGFFGMIGVSNGMIKGHVDSLTQLKLSDGSAIENSDDRRPSVYFKGGFDQSIAAKIRLRLSGSLYHNSAAYGSGLTLYSGDRAGSQYQNVMENKPLGTASTSMYTSGRFNPNMRNKLTAVMLNGLLKAGGLELFGTYELANGRSGVELTDRKMTQYAGDVIYRFGASENFYVGGRYNKVDAELLFSGAKRDVSVNRTALAAGWFMTKNVLLKGEYVTQKYSDFPVADFRSGGKFNGYVIQAIVGF